MKIRIQELFGEKSLRDLTSYVCVLMMGQSACVWILAWRGPVQVFSLIEDYRIELLSREPFISV